MEGGPSPGRPLIVRFLGLVYGIGALGLAMVLALFFGLTMILPFWVVPRGRRERFTMVGVMCWARATTCLLSPRVRMTGGVQLNAGEGALVVCNHRSWLDPLLLMGWVGSIGLSKKSIAYIPFVGFFGWLAGTVYFDRRDKAQRGRARDEAMFLLHRGHRIFIFPEGTRSRTGELREKIYVALLKDCFEAGVSILPCAVWGTDRTLPVGERLAVPFQSVRLHVGLPMRPADFSDADSFAAACWDEIRVRVRLLSCEAAGAIEAG